MAHHGALTVQAAVVRWAALLEAATAAVLVEEALEEAEVALEQEVTLAAGPEVCLSAEAMEAECQAACLGLAHQVMEATEVTAAPEATAVQAAPQVAQAMVVRDQVPLPSQAHLEAEPEAHTVQKTMAVTTSVETSAPLEQAASRVVQEPVLVLVWAAGYRQEEVLVEDH